MESNFCLTRILADKFKNMVESGKISPENMVKMSSAERNEFFTKEFGENNASEINALFESKLLLKNQTNGLINWAKQLSGISEPARKDMISKIMNMDKILDTSAGGDKTFLKDLASKRLGTEVNAEEAKNIIEMSNKIKGLQDYGDDSEKRTEYGLAKLDLMDYINELNPEKKNLAVQVANVPRAAMSSMDLSAPLNQGFGAIGKKEFKDAYMNMFKYAGSEKNYRELMANIITNDNYKIAKSSGLRLTGIGDNILQKEENFMTNLLEGVPGYRGSERAYTGFLNDLRFSWFNNMMDKAEAAGEDIGSKSDVPKQIAEMVNMFTGGSRVGKFEGAVPWLNTAIFSPRKIVSTLHILNPWTYLNPKVSPTVRKESAKRLVAMSAYVTTIGKMFEIASGGEAKFEADPRSSDFGKVVMGNTHLDLTGGIGTYITLAARLKTGETVDSKTGKVTKIGEKYGSTDKWGYVMKALRSKLSPNASFAVDTITGKDFNGQPVTITKSALNRITPMFASSLVSAVKDYSGGTIPAGTLAVFGSGLNTYDDTKKTSSGRSGRSGRDSRNTTR